MSLWEIVLLAVGLAMDSTAVAAARALSAPRLRVTDVLLIGFLMGAFQAGMPLLGYLAGARIGPYVESFDHWLAFVVLVFLGGKMLKEAFGDDEDQDEDVDANSAFSLRVLVPLAVATSIDALAVGVTLPLLHAPMVLTLAMIGGVTAVLSAGGALLGRRLGAHLGPRLEVVGGLALIGIGTKILLGHLLAG